MLIQVAAQLRRADMEFRDAATHLLELLSVQAGKPLLNMSLDGRPSALRPASTGDGLPILSLGKRT
jgi:hypothetical protein